jgi:hypothetical protein
MPQGVEMLRPICLALFCLFLLGALFAVRSTIAARAMSEPAFADRASEAISETEDGPPLAKADKLPSVDPDAMKRVSVIPIEVTPVEKQIKETPKAKETSKAETTHWHWHVGSKISKRTAN